MEFLKNRRLQKCQKPLKYKDFLRFLKDQKHCEYVIVTEQKARTTYDNILRLTDDPDVRDPIKFLRAREIVHYQRFGDALRIVTDKLDSKNFYAYNPAFDFGGGKCGCQNNNRNNTPNDTCQNNSCRNNGSRDGKGCNSCK